MRSLLPLLLFAVPAVAADTDKSAAAVKDLRAALDAKPASVADLAEKPFASVPLTKADAAAARELLLKAHEAIIKKDRADEVKDKVLKAGKLEMPYSFKTFGKKPKDGWSLWISMHGGGGAPKEVNDGQWENQKGLYKPEEGIYLAPRAPTNTWNLWHEPHIDGLFDRLIEDMVVFEGVNPNRVYLMGYSAGGDGVYQLAPRMADRWAAAAMMAGHPNGVSLQSLRNVPFALQVGEKDAAYKRNEVAKEYADKLVALRKDDPDGYEHLYKLHEGKGHWMNLEDKVAVPWMAKFTRDPVPAKVVWKQTGTTHERSYWLAVPPKAAKPDTLVVAKREKQTVTVEKVEKVDKLIVRFDDRMADLDKPVEVVRDGKKLFSGDVTRTIGVMAKTLAGRGDAGLVFDGEVEVTVPK